MNHGPWRQHTTPAPVETLVHHLMVANSSATSLDLVSCVHHCWADAHHQKQCFFYKHHMLCYQNKLYTRWNLCKMRYNEFKTHVQVTVMIMMNGNWTCKKKNMTVYSLSPWCLGNAMALSFNSFLLLKEHCHSAKIKLCGTHVFCHTCFGLDYTDNRLLTTKKCPGKVLRLLPWWPYVHETNHQIWNASKCPHTNNSNKATMPVKFWRSTCISGGKHPPRTGWIAI